MSDDRSRAPAAPLLRVGLAATPTPEELAALVAVLAALGSAAAARRRAATPGVAGAPPQGARRRYPHGPGGWRSSGLPR